MLIILLTTTIVSEASLVVPAAIIGGGYALGSALGLWGQSNTNSANERIARMNNEFNAQQNELAWQRSQIAWERQNSYNSPAEQMKRYEEAGISPYLVASQGNSGNAGTMNVPSPVTAQSYTYQSPLSALSSFFTNVGPAILSFMSGYEQLKQQQLETNYKATTLPDRIGVAKNNLALSQWQLNNNEYISSMNRIKAKLMETFGMSNAEFEAAMLRNRAAASTYDKMMAESKARMLGYDVEHARRGYDYESKFGYNGREDWLSGVERANSTGGAILRALSGLGKGSGLDAKVLDLVKYFFK